MQVRSVTMQPSSKVTVRSKSPWPAFLSFFVNLTSSVLLSP